MNQDARATKRSRGRPPSLEAKSKALRAARDILMEEGLGRLTMDAVVARSGVGKPTIYRNWANASELAMAALMLDGQADAAHIGLTLQQALKEQMRTLVAAFATTRGRQIALALAASDPESEMTRAFRNSVILSSRETGSKLIRDAVSRSEIEHPANLEVILDMIYAPLFYRLLIGHLPLNAAFAETLANQAMVLLR